MTSSDLRTQLQAALGDAYAIEGELGGGGMSRVFVAEERALGRRVVVKVLPPDTGAGLSVERFRREIQLAARLQHPHIVPLLAAGDAGGVPYFTMPFVEGSSLRDRLREAPGPLPPREAVRLLRDVAAALEYAHGCGVVHRDIKPDNVLVSHGSAMVTDFGVAKAVSSARLGAVGDAAGGGTLTALGTSLGTPAYMAPEQAAADPATDHRADLYSFGVLAYELLAGEAPFAGRAPHAMIVAHLTEAPRPLAERQPALPAALAALVDRCLAKDPAARPQSAADVVRALDDVPLTAETAAAGAAAAARRPPFAPPARRRTRLGIAAAVAGLAAVAGGVWMARGGAARGGDVPPPTSLAVLPLVNVGGDARNEYFSDGMTDELTDALSAVPGLRVVSRTSAFAYKNKNVDAREIGRALNVGALLEGRVRRQGERLRVSAQLTGASDGLTLWSATYEREMKDVFAVQDEIAGAIAGALRLRLAAGPGAPRGEGAHRGTADLAAYDLYLRGRYFFHRRGGDALRQAAGFFQQAIARDPRYAEAHAGLADVAALLPIYSDAPADSAFRVAEESARKAVALDSTLAEAHTTLGLVLKSTGRWVSSEEAFRRALALDPRYAPAHQWLGELLLITGRVEEAIAPMQQAAALDPLSPVVHAELAYTLALAGRADAAYVEGRRGVELGPGLWTTHAFLGHAYLFGGRTADAVRELETAVRLDSTMTPVAGTLAYAYGAAGDGARARAIAARLGAAAEAPNGSAVAAAMAYAGAGDRERALAWLERAADRRDSWLYAMSVNAPFFDLVRGDPRFAAVVRRMGLDVARMTAARAHNDTRHETSR